MASNYRAGLQPRQRDELPFSVRTSEVQAYLQKKIDGLERVRNESEKKDGIQNPDKTHANIKVFTGESGEKFYPFVVTLPLSVIKTDNDDNRKSNNSNESSIFMTDDDEGRRKVKLKDIYSKIMHPYAYSDRDVKAFKSEDWKRVRRVSGSASAALENFAYPRIVKVPNTNQKAVVMVIDPIRVFFDMVQNRDDRRDYQIEIRDIKKLGQGEYKYYFNRVISKNKKKDKNSSKAFMDQILRNISGR